ncbi:MAG TPA: S49 family peptidase, partial [Tepidisphaeraceae bacterium]
MTSSQLPPPPPAYGPPALQPIILPATRGGGFARAVFTTLAITIFGLSLTLNIWMLAYLAMSSSDGIDRVVLTEGDPDTAVAVVPLDHEITAESVEGFVKLLRTVADDASVKAVVVEINTPGGTVGGSDRIHGALTKLKLSRKLPVVVAMGDLATSGGYYIACAADHVVAGRTTWTGNIGVLLPR